jgi:hypothetical protein
VRLVAVQIRVADLARDFYGMPATDRALVRTELGQAGADLPAAHLPELTDERRGIVPLQ